MAEWIGGGVGEPWSSFATARDLNSAGDIKGAQAIWTRIASTPDLESRHAVQAWTFLRASGVEPPESIGAEVLGAIAEVPMDKAHDVLAAYRDGSVRYLNHSGSASVVDKGVNADVDAAVTEWLAVASKLALDVGTWDDALPAVPKGHCRVLMLTPAGPRFGQGPYDLLSADPAAGPFLNAATAVLVRVADLSK